MPRVGALPAVSVVVPTYNEAPNVAELVRRVAAAADGVLDVEILFVDDSNDSTPEVVTDVAAVAPVPVRLHHRDDPVGGLSGAVCEGLVLAQHPVVVVMDGDLQHPPELVPALVAALHDNEADVAVASRYLPDGSAGGLAGLARRVVSATTTAVTRAMFPRRLADCSDPMTGFFAVRREAVDLEALHPQGFKILLEILARQYLRVCEIPFVFGERLAGESKANLVQGWRFLAQLAALRFGRMSKFAVIGGVGALLNIALVWAMTKLEVPYLAAAVVAAEVTIVTNFLLQERYVFRDLRHGSHGPWGRFLRSFLFNNVETALRLPVLALLVSTWHFTAVLATGITLLVAFVARFTFLSRVVYRQRRRGAGQDTPSVVDVSDDEVGSRQP